jgi:hypothetical protein
MSAQRSQALRNSAAARSVAAEQLRDEQHSTPSRPSRHPRASDESIRARLRGALEENKQLHAENTQLRDELAHAHGEVRELKLASRHRSTG